MVGGEALSVEKITASFDKSELSNWLGGKISNEAVQLSLNVPLHFDLDGEVATDET